MELAKIAAKGSDALRDEVYDTLKKDYPEDVLQWVKEAHWELKEVPLSEINMSRRPGGRNMEKVNKIAQAVREGKPMGPVTLVEQSDGRYQIADGYHRTLGFQKAEKDKIEAYVATDVEDDGPWDEEMHAQKLNVEPGKKASPIFEGLSKVAEGLNGGQLQLLGDLFGHDLVQKNYAKQKQWMESNGVKVLAKTANDHQGQLGILPQLAIILGSAALGGSAGYMLDRKLETLPTATLTGGALGAGMGSIATNPAAITPENIQGISRNLIEAMAAGQQISGANKDRERKEEEDRKSREKKPDTTARSGQFTKKAGESLFPKSAVPVAPPKVPGAAHNQQMIRLQKAKEFQNGQRAMGKLKVPGGGVTGGEKQLASMLGLNRFAFERGTRGMSKRAHYDRYDHDRELTPADRVVGTVVGGGLGLGGLALMASGFRNLPALTKKLHVMTDEGLKEGRIPTTVIDKARNQDFPNITNGERYVKGHPSYTGYTADDAKDYAKANSMPLMQIGAGGLLGLSGGAGVYNSLFHHPEREHTEG